MEKELTEIYAKLSAAHKGLHTSRTLVNDLQGLCGVPYRPGKWQPIEDGFQAINEAIELLQTLGHSS